jgi:tetratricopeptide (TPR) repeat protein
MRNVARFLSLSLLMLVLTAVCHADLFSEGKDLYKSGDYAGAAAKLEQATQQEPNNAKIWWQLNFTYNKLKRYDDALKAVEKAGQLDPAHTFASEPGKYEQILGSMKAKAGGATSKPANNVNRGGQTGNDTRRTAGQSAGSPAASYSSGGIVKRLLDGDVYIAPGMNVDGDRLQRVATELRPTVVKFVVYNEKLDARTLDRYAHDIRDHLSIGSGYVIAASRSAVAVSSSQLNKDTLKQLTKQIAPEMETGSYTSALETLGRGLVQTKKTQVANTGRMWIMIFVVIGGIIVLWLVIRSVSNAQKMAARREPLERLKSDVINQMNFLDDQMALVDAATASRVREARIAAGTRLDEAAHLILKASTDRDLSRAQSLLDQAQAEIARGRSIIDRAQSGGGAPSGGRSAPPTGTGVPPVVTSPTTNWESVPKEERGVCFFCSRPSLLSELTPVTVNLDGKQQKVLACFDDLQTIKSGQMPQMRAFNVNGQYVPWYAANNYNPYTDYYSRGYNNRSLMSDLITMSVIDSMFWGWHRPMGWGWGGGYGWGGGNTYVFYPDHEYYHDYYGGQASSYGDFDRGPSDAGGTDFIQSTGGDYSSGSDYNSGGTNFGGDQS